MTRANGGLCIALVLVAAVGAGQSIDQPRPPDPVFRAHVDAVQVDVLVTRDRRPVLGLGAGDFELTDNGVRQQIDDVGVDESAVNLILAVDLSGSVAGQPLRDLTRASEVLLESLRPTDRIALLTFSHVVALRCALTDPTACVTDALTTAVAAGETALVDGTQAAILAAAEAAPGRNVIVVLSGRFDTVSWLTPEHVLDSARRADAVVYAVASGPESRFVRDVTAATGGRTLRLESSASLGKTFLAILEEFRRRYVLRYVPRGVAAGGWHDIRVRLLRGRGEIRARPGYQRGTP